MKKIRTFSCPLKGIVTLTSWEKYALFSHFVTVLEVPVGAEPSPACLHGISYLAGHAVSQPLSWDLSVGPNLCPEQDIQELEGKG